MLKDKFNRIHDYLRISLTDNCNLRCFYCMPEEDYDFTPPSRLMQPDEIERLAQLFVTQGVNKIRLTGGEPLVRKDAADIIRRLGKLPVKLSITTNAVRLHEFIDVFEEAGLRSLNISLDSLKPETFFKLTRRDQFQQVMDNIQLAQQRGFEVKLNVVAMKGINDQEIPDFVQLTKDSPLSVRFIEFMPFQGNQWHEDKVLSLAEILKIVGEKYRFTALKNGLHDTGKSFQVNGHTGTFAVISTMSAPFCSGCNRMRLTADGKMKNCLFSAQECDLLSALRQGEDVVPLIEQSLSHKAKELGGQFVADIQQIDPQAIKNRSMITIGG